jgi:uncharacterized protein
MLHKIICFLITLWITLASHVVLALDFPALTGPIVDEAGIFSGSQYSYLKGQLKNAPHQIVAVSLRDLRGLEIEDYIVQLARHWGIGQKGINDGVIVAIAPAQKRMHIAVGYGLEGVITDIQANQIIQNTMLPLARTGEYGEAVVRGVSRVLNLLYKAGQLSDNQEKLAEDKNEILGPVSSDGIPLVIQKMLDWIGYLVVALMIWTAIKDWLCTVNSYVNRFLFIIEVIICHVICGLFIYFSVKYAMEFFAVIVGIFLLISDYRYYQSWCLNPRFPCQPSKVRVGYSGSSSSNKSDSSFHGGGGSFGGGGATGRW